MKKAVLVPLIAIVILISSLGAYFFIDHHRNYISGTLPEPEVENAVQTTPDVPEVTPTAEPLIEPTPSSEAAAVVAEKGTETETIALSYRTKAILYAVGIVIVLGWMASLGFLIYRRYEFLLTQSILQGQGTPSAWSVISDIFYPRVSSTTIVSVVDEHGVVQDIVQSTPQTPEGITERYGLLALAIGFIVGVISFSSTLAATKNIETAAISGAKSAIFSAIGQVTVLFIISYL